MHLRSKQVQTIDGIRVTAKTFKRNFFFYKSIGAKVKVKIPKRRRNEVDLISIENSYYSKTRDIPVPVPAAFQRGERRHKRSYKLKHWAVGFGVKLTFPGGSATPDVPSGLLPLNGVVSEATVTINGRSSSFETGKGRYP